MSDYVKNENDMSDFEPVGNLIESVAAAGSFVGAAFLLAKTKKGSNFISNIDPLIGRIGNRITRFSDDGANALTLNEIFNGISNNKFKTIEELAPAIDNERNIGFIKRVMSAEMDPRRSGEQFISQMYETSVKDSLNSLLPDAGTGGVEAINQMINEVGFNNVFDSAIGKFKPSFKQHVYDTMEGYYDGKKILKGGDNEQAFYKQLDSLVDDYKTLTKKEFSETQPVQDALTNFQNEFISSLINEQNKIIESQLSRERITGLKGHTLGDFYEDVKSGRREYNGEFDVTLLTDKGLPVTKNFFDIMEDEKFAQLRDRIKDVNISDSYWTSEEGRVLNFKNFNELKNKTSEIFHDTLPAKLIGVDDIEKPIINGFDIFSKNDFVMYGKKYVDYGKNFTRIGDQAYQLDMSTGTLEKINAPDARWIRSDTRTVKSAKFASQHATNRLEEDKNFWQRGSSPIKNVTEEFGNNYNYFMRTDSSDLTITKDPAIGTRVFGFKRAVEGIQIDLEDNTLNKIKNSLSVKDQNGVLGKLFDALEAENVNQKKQIIKEFGDTELKVDDLRTVHTAIKRGRRVKPKLASDEMSIANKSLYQKNSVKTTINNSLKKEIINSLGDNKDEAFKRIDSLDIIRAEKQKLKDAYSLEKFKQRTGLSSFRSEHDATTKGAPLGGSYARKIKEELEFDYDVQSAFNHHLGKGKDYKASYEQKHTDKRLVLVNKGLDIKDTLSKLNKLDAVGVIENGIKGIKGLLANTNQYSLLSTRYFPFNIYNKNVNANDMSVAGGMFYHMANRLSEGLNSMDLSTALGFVNQNLGETAAAKFNLSLPLGLSQRASGSALGILDNLLLKRVLPLSFALTQLDWADDTFNINENFQTGWANLDLAFRKFTDNTGLTNVLKLTKMAGPMFQYWGGDYRPYQSYDERLDYYQNGKDPIRSGRYWVWGSTNEFRGGSISYWEDNSLKLAQSDYRMESIYGGYFNKWMRSPIPTLSNPLSPLVYAMNPYWLEEKHMEDRPYLESGPLFEQNTLQGLILNPTLGELIKPKKKYHQDRMYNGRDVKAIMYHMNQQIQEGIDNRYVIFQNGRLGVYDFTAFNHPNSMEYVQFEDNQYYGNQPVYASAKDYVNYINNDGSVNPGIANLQPVTQGTGSAITAMNNAVHSGNGNPAGAYIQSRIRRGKFKGQIEDILNDADLYNNLMNSNGGQSYLDELQTTARLLTGIYGYGASSIFGRDESKFIANAGDIDSFTRSFWDAGIGGVGGEGAEIARRFLPEFSRRRRVNPLLNTMAEQHPWLPEKFFTSDPYCVSKNTMIEVGDLDYLAADKIVENKSIITDHTGQNTIVNKIICRKIEKEEKVYSIKINSLFAFDYEFSENHPLLITESHNNTTKELSEYSLSYYKKANIILNALKNGITQKKELFKIVNISINDICMLWKRMLEDDLIFDYKLDKYNIYLKNYKLYDINLLKNRLYWEKAKNIKVGNYVAYPIPKSKNEEIIIDLSLLIPEYVSTEKYIYTSKVRNKQFVEIYEYLENNGIHSFSREERKLFLKKMNWNDIIYENVQAKFRNKKLLKRIPKKFVLTKQICYAFGLYLAEGWNDDHWVGMAHNINERDYAYNAFIGFKQIDPNINFLFRQIKNTNGANSGFGSSIIAKLLNILFDKGAHNKKIPEFFWNAKEECILGLLEGYMCGDGSNFVVESGHGANTEKISITSCNKKLLYQVRKLLLRFNIVGSINFHNKEQKKIKFGKYNITSGISYSLNIRGKKASILSEMLFGKSLLPINYEAKEASHHYISNGYLYLRVEKIEEISTVKEVYGYQVNQNNSFCVVGFATHNTKIINGEARLPGEGYEAINALHPDQFASDGYGAIDRYKILADIAPNSTEYKFWKQIVKMMNSDEAKKVLKDTEEMVKHQGKKHDFYDYKFLGKDTVALDGHVEEVLSNGKFKITGDDRLYQIAGVKFKDNGFMSKQQLLQVIQPGEHVTLRIDDEERSDVPGMTEAPIKAAMFLNGENISDSLRNMGLADYDMEDTSAAGAYANYGLIGRLFGSGAELLAHAQIPILHSQLMRVNSPLEEYRSDQLYGAGFESWDDMLGSYILPTLEQSKTSFIRDMIADTTYRLYTAIDSRAIQASKFQRGALKFASTYLDGPALAGEIAGRFTFMGGNSSKYRDRLSKLGRGIGNTFALYTSTDDPMYAAYVWGRFGYDSLKYINLFPNLNATLGEGIGEAFLGNSAVNAKGLAGDILESIRKTKVGRAAQVAAFAGVGLGISLAKNNPLTDALGINRVYTPDEVLKRWDTEDYFDRLRYIKYMGLYEAAKDKALKEEGVDVDKLYLRQEALRAEMDGEVSITDMMSSVLTSGTPSNDPMVQWINKRFGRLSDDMTTLAAGEYTEQAIMYHQVAESTVYALNKNSEYSDIIRALPSTEKEYFIEFAKVTSEKQRREILRNVSPSLAKALKLVWYQEDTEVESNESYFLNHNLPGPLWEGWSASSNMEDIKAKVIYNEGMTYADYGIYSSVYEDENVINAPNIEDIKDGDDPITVRAKLNTIMNGLALSDRQIKVNEISNDGIVDVFNNVTAVIGYKIDKALSIF